jgi:RNA polymerase sigma factor (sigma-70 family)
VVSDERLARMVAEGSDRAFATLYSRFHQPLYRYCHSMVRNEADAQDALQSTFTAALGALRRSQRDAPLRPWLFRIAHNESISLLRRRRVTEELPETMEAPGRSVEATAEERARLALLVSDLQALPERQRGALVMRELSGLSHEDVAQALGISVGAAKQTVFEARQALQEFSEGRAMACEDIQRVVSDGDKRALRGRRVRAHLRECSRCHAFAEAIPERRTALLALSPALPAAAASGLFGRIVGASGAHHGTGGGLLAGAGTKSLGVALSAKTVATGVAIVATAAAGTVGAVEVVSHGGHQAAASHLVRSESGHGSAAGGSSAAHHHSLGASHGRSAHAARANHHGRSAAGSHGAAAGHAGRGLAGGSSTTTTASGSGSSSSTGHAGGQSTSHSTSPNAGGTNPNAHGGNPNAGGGNTSGSGNAGGTNPNAHGGNPNARGGNINAHGGNPNAGGGSTNAHGSNPNAGGGSSNGVGHGGSTGTGVTGPSGVTGNTNSHGGNPHAHSGH